MITVFGAPPTRAMRAVWMLEEMGLDYEIHPVDFATRMNDAEFLKVSPTGAIPGLRDGDVEMMESCAIIEYLGVKYGPTPLVPSREDRTYPAFLSYLHFGEASLSAPLNVAMASRFFAPEDQKDNWGAQAAIEMFLGKSAVLAPRLGRAPFLTGEVFTAADISCGYAIGLAAFLGLSDRLDPALVAYQAKLSERPAFQRAARHTRMPF